jgi:hypothetical protein
MHAIQQSFIIGIHLASTDEDDILFFLRGILYILCLPVSNTLERLQQSIEREKLPINQKLPCGFVTLKKYF